LRWWRFNS